MNTVNIDKINNGRKVYHVDTSLKTKPTKADAELLVNWHTQQNSTEEAQLRGTKCARELSNFEGLIVATLNLMRLGKPHIIFTKTLFSYAYLFASQEQTHIDQYYKEAMSAIRDQRVCGEKFSRNEYVRFSKAILGIYPIVVNAMTSIDWEKYLSRRQNDEEAINANVMISRTTDQWAC